MVELNIGTMTKCGAFMPLLPDRRWTGDFGQPAPRNRGRFGQLRLPMASIVHIGKIRCQHVCHSLLLALRQQLHDQDE